MKKLLQAKGISKQFPGVIALDTLDLEIESGEVLAIVGENGAGKSTLIKIIAGAYQPDSGSLFVHGLQVEKLNPRKSIELGIAVIYQEPSYLPLMSIAENIYVGRQPKKAGRIDYQALKQQSAEIQKEVGLDHLDPFTPAIQLSAGEKQLLEIARAYARKMELLILDEPTSALNEKETQKLFSLINKLRSEGKGIIYISHKLDEIFELADRVQVLRDGHSIKVSNLSDTSRDGIVRDMIGRELKDMYPIGERKIGETSFEVKNLTDSYLKDVTFSARSGEIVGLYGLMGSGCSESLKCIFGIRKKDKGNIYVAGLKKEINNPGDAVKIGIAYIPDERKTEGILPGLSVMTNISVVTLRKYRSGPVLSPAKEKQIASKWMQDLNIKAPSLSTPIETLSGGNQQKVIIAKWLDNNPSVFLMNEPTKGLDVGAKVEIYKQIEALCHKGCAVVLVATDLPELLALSDRVYVFHNGMITNEFEKSQMTQEKIIKSAIGE